MGTAVEGNFTAGSAVSLACDLTTDPSIRPPMKLRDLNAPAVGYTLTLLVASLTAVGWLRGEMAALQKDADNRDKSAARLIAARDRENDTLERRIAALEDCHRKP